MIHCLAMLATFGDEKMDGIFQQDLTPKIQKAGRLAVTIVFRQRKIPWEKGSTFSLHLVTYTSHITNICKITSAGKIALLDIKCSPVVLWCFLQYASICTTWSQPVLGTQNVNILNVWRIFFGARYIMAATPFPNPKSDRASLPLAFATWRKPPATSQDVRFSMDCLRPWTAKILMLHHAPLRIIGP